MQSWAVVLRGGSEVGGAVGGQRRDTPSGRSPEGGFEGDRGDKG